MQNIFFLLQLELENWIAEKYFRTIRANLLINVKQKNKSRWLVNYFDDSQHIMDETTSSGYIS